VDELRGAIADNIYAEDVSRSSIPACSRMPWSPTGYGLSVIPIHH
jgi:hypothetical protein